MSAADLDRAAEAALASAITEGGDLMAAFTLLCASVRMGDVEGETYTRALERMACRHFGYCCTAVVLQGGEE
ncbi:hypothetical protein [uncultured Methylobacterium sp.]|jgi:hypothetical protein|uniref:hypothetical protein n=1 Tax=uncultured Methylobacterium sp. TaxID=157278 RepID=UPI002623F262|nr:hypothetical protein [uncultured Methylobacterium sp.]